MSEQRRGCLILMPKQLSKKKEYVQNLYNFNFLVSCHAFLNNCTVWMTFQSFNQKFWLATTHNGIGSCLPTARWRYFPPRAPFLGLTSNHLSSYYLVRAVMKSSKTNQRASGKNQFWNFFSEINFKELRKKDYTRRAIIIPNKTL